MISLEQFFWFSVAVISFLVAFFLLYGIWNDWRHNRKQNPKV